MHFYLPRRYRRRLLFPPGLLALAGLLWLGCVALGPWQEALKVRSVLQLTMPMMASATPAGLPPPPPPLTQIEFNKMLPWHDAYFDNNSLVNENKRIWIANAVHNMMSDTKTGSGVRIEFMVNSHYKDLVYAINLMNEENVRRWFIDIRQAPVVLYAFTEDNDSQKLYRSSEEYSVPPCGGMTILPKNRPPEYMSPSYTTRFENWITTLWNPSLANSPFYNSANYAVQGTKYKNLTFGYEQLYLRDTYQYLTKLIIPFEHVEWSISFGLLILLIMTIVLRIKYQVYRSH